MDQDQAYAYNGRWDFITHFNPLALDDISLNLIRLYYANLDSDMAISHNVSFSNVTRNELG